MKFAEFAENHRFQISKGAHWKHVRENTKNVGMAIQKAMRQIEKANPDTLFGIFGDAQWTNKDRFKRRNAYQFAGAFLISDTIY